MESASFDSPVEDFSAILSSRKKTRRIYCPRNTRKARKIRKKEMDFFRIFRAFRGLNDLFSKILREGFASLRG